MLRFGLVLVAVLLSSFPPAAIAQDKAAGMPTVSWFGQSFFTVKSSQGTVVAFDPHLLLQYGRPEAMKADLVLMSHLHNDHTATFVFENEKTLKAMPGLTGFGKKTNWNPINEKFKDISIRTVASYHDAAEGMIRGKNTIFLVEIDGWRFCHLGDLGHELTPAQLKKIGEVDVLMVPVGGIYTLNGSEAKKVVEQIQPKEYIFPMHYGNKVFDEVLPVDEFLEDQNRANIAVSDDNRVTLNRDPQRPKPLIVQLNFAPKRK